MQPEPTRTKFPGRRDNCNQNKLDPLSTKVPVQPKLQPEQSGTRQLQPEHSARRQNKVEEGAHKLQASSAICQGVLAREEPTIATRTNCNQNKVASRRQNKVNKARTPTPLSQRSQCSHNCNQTKSGRRDNCKMQIATRTKWKKAEQSGRERALQHYQQR